MLNFYRKLSKTKKVAFLALIFILSFPLGAIFGLMLGLVATTFIPICCDGGSCHNCFEFNGMVGYEATATIGFWSGLFLLPLLFVLTVLYLKVKGKI